MRRIHLLLLMVVAFATRFSYLLYRGGPKMGGDSGYYLSAAESIAKGNLDSFFYNPFYQLYPLLLSPIYVFDLKPQLYISIIHLALSLLTVILITLSAERWLSKSHAICAGLLAALQPHLIFWMPYVLSETLFLFLLSVLVATLATFSLEPTLSRTLAVVVTFLALCGNRMVSIVLAPTLLIIIEVFWHRKNPKIVYSGMAVLLLASFMWIGGVTYTKGWQPISAWWLKHPTFSGQVNLAARLSSSNFDEYDRVTLETKQFTNSLPSYYSPVQIKEAVSLEALRIIRNDPFRYFRFCIKRFACFWFPGLWQGRFSVAHLVLDTTTGILLWFALLSPLILPTRQSRFLWIPISLSFSLSILHALTYMDSDGRYRLPAELLLLVPLAYGLVEIGCKLYRIVIKPTDVPIFRRGPLHG